jgi:predicted ATPase
MVCRLQCNLQSTVKSVHLLTKRTTDAVGSNSEAANSGCASVMLSLAKGTGSGADYLPSAAFLFKHALVQDTTYSLLPRGPRRALHARIARALEERFPEHAE